MKLFRRAIALLLVAIMMLSLCGCRKTSCVKIGNKNKASTPKGKITSCGTFTFDGNLGKSGTVKLSGTYTVQKVGTVTYSIKNEKYTYKTVDGYLIFTRCSSFSPCAPKSIKGMYNASTNTFTIEEAQAYCEITR